MIQCFYSAQLDSLKKLETLMSSFSWLLLKEGWSNDRRGGGKER